MTFLTAEWRDLVVLTFEIAPAVLRPHLPPGLRLDSWEGKALVSLVGFRFLNTRVLGSPAWFHRGFPEVNLRFYVRRDTAEGPRRGVVFIREIVPRRVVSTLARLLYNENYVCLPMTQVVDPGTSAEYGWTFQRRGNRIAAATHGTPALPTSDSLDTFILEHQWGYSIARNGGCIEYRVDRPDWRTYPIASFEMEVDAGPLYGAEFAEALRGQPLSTILAEGSPVKVGFGMRMG